MPRVLLAVLLLAAPVFAQKEHGFDNRKGSGQAYLKPDETVTKMKVPAEFEVKLFAGEPDLANPIAFTIDEKGRVWAIECFEYPSRTPKGKAPRDRIVILEDTDGDGKCDKRTVFAEGKDFPVTEERKKAGLGAFDLASGIEVGNGGVYVGAPPYLWFIENKDDKPGKFEPVLKGFGSEDTHETLNTFQWGPDGWLYGLHGVFTNSKVESLDGPETRMNAAVWRMHPKTKKFEIFAEGTSNPWGMDWRNTDGQFILACCVIPHLYHIVPGGIYKRQAGASFNPHAYDYIKEICDHTFHKESGWAHAGLISLDVPHMPEKYRNSVIFGSIHGCSVKQNILKPNGSSYSATRGDDFLVSGDKNFRPINLKWGPNGDIYLIDWHDQMPCHQAKPDEWDYERGRVYRIQVKGRKGKKTADLGKMDPAELALTATMHEDPFTRRTALRLVHEMSDEGVQKATARIPDGLPGLKNLDFMLLKVGRQDALEPFLLNAGSFDRLATEAPGQVVEIIRRLPNELKKPAEMSKALTTFAECKDVNIRREVASLAVRLADKHDVTELLHALMKQKDDAKDPLVPHLTWVAYEKVLASGGRQPPGGGKKEKDQGADAPRSPKLADELAFLAKEAPDNIFVRDQIVPKVMRRLVATGQPDDLKLCVKFVADVKDTNTREKALDGLELALRDQTVDAPAEWKAVRDELKKEPRFTGLVNKLSVSFRDPEAVARALAVVNDAAKPDADRTEAVRQLVQLKAKEAPDLFRALALTDGEKAMAVRTEAARGLVAFDRPDLPKAVLAAWKGLPANLQSELVNTLAARKPWAMELLKAMDAKTIDRGIVTDNTVTRMQAFNDGAINTLIEKAWGKTRKTPDELNKLIDKTRASLNTSTASFTAGKKVFENQCAKCHKFEGKGAEVGPALDGAGRDIEYLLANVLDPNRVVGAPYFVRTANLMDGQTIQGLLHAEDDQSITLKTENAVLKRIPKKDLDGAVKVAEKSMMPEGLTSGMTEQDFRDLIRYVMAHPYLTDVSMDGKKLTVPVTGRIPLPQAKDTGETVLVFEVTATEEVKTTLQLAGEFMKGVAVTLDGKVVAVGLEGIEAPLTLSKGKHTLSITVSYKGTKAWAQARLLDPDRKLSQPDGK
jgi:putative membrane-bound dehydrogenase-like protein